MSFAKTDYGTASRHVCYPQPVTEAKVLLVQTTVNIIIAILSCKSGGCCWTMFCIQRTSKLLFYYNSRSILLSTWESFLWLLLLRSAWSMLSNTSSWQ